MNKTLLFPLLCLMAIATLHAQQTPTRFNYQAAVRNASGAPIVNQLVSLQISINDGSPNGQSQYTERHILSTNDFGLVNLQIGAGQVQSGSFSNITWGGASKWLKIDIDPNAGTNFIPLGAAELVSVPYALYAQNAGNSSSTLDQLSDVNTSGVQTGQVLQWNGSQWVAATATGPAGPQGPTGPQGTQGPPGPAGPDGGWTDGASITTTNNSKKVGIGTATPTQKFQLHDNDNSATWFQITNGSNGAGASDGAFIGMINTDIKIENCEAGKITLGTCTDPDQLVIKNDGRVGIGTPDPSTLLHLKSEGNYIIQDPILGPLFNYNTDSPVYLEHASQVPNANSSGFIVYVKSNPNGDWLNDNKGGRIILDAREAIPFSFNQGLSVECMADQGEFTCSGIYTKASGGNTNRGIYTVGSGDNASSNTALSAAVSGTNVDYLYAVHGSIDGTANNFAYAIRGASGGQGSANHYAGYFEGKTHVQGTLSKSGGSFKIDHPQDPANKYLQHSFVESPDMMNVYNGNIVTDGTGSAVVELPAYFETLNRDFRYQLTCIGQFAQVIVAEKIKNNQFTIKTDKPSVEVSWQVTGIRHDPWAERNRIEPELEKVG
ncbi:MAG: hypothetical protein JNJ57_16885 [Saprospiraceae bacterium]|nr:hypothetical protein [Saprospiraceae bacterium]